MTKEEIYKVVEELIVSDLYLLFKGNFFNSEQPTPITSQAQIGETKRIIIWIKNQVAEPKCSSKGAGNYIDKFLFDYYFDPIIEFDIETPIDNLILPCRLFYKTGWLKDNLLRDMHIKSTNNLVRTIRKKLETSDKLKPFYISKGTIELLEKGYEFELGQGGRKINKHLINGT